MDLSTKKTVAALVQGVEEHGITEEEMERRSLTWKTACTACLRRFPSPASLPLHKARWCCDVQTEEKYAAEKVVDKCATTRGAMYRVL